MTRSPALTRPVVRSICAAVAVTLSLGLVACGDRKAKTSASQTAAKVNKDEITVHQINFLLQQQRGVRPEQVEAASRALLERLVDQQLAVQKADELKLDRDPKVVQQLEAARREILVRAYVDRLGESAAKPTPEEIKAYYASKPALFAERRVYNIVELLIEAKPEQLQELREKLAGTKEMGAFTAFLKSSGLRYVENQAVRAAEQLPLQSLEAFAKLKDGQAVALNAPNGLQVILLQGSRNEPVSEEQARTMIEQFLLNDRKRKLVEDDMKALRKAATIEYVGKFAQPAGPVASGAAAAAASVAAPMVPAASSPLNANDISKGMGLK